mgnify:CR=1 FL=1
MKTLLINPPSPDFVVFEYNIIPSSLLYLASSLQEKGEKVRILDINNDITNLKKQGRINTKEYLYGKLEEELLSFNPDFVGISCLFSGRFKPTIDIARRVKNQGDIPIVLGGMHPTIFPREILQEYSCVDYVCIGEGERTLVDLVRGKNPEKIDGLAYRKGIEVRLNPKTSFIKDLDSLSFPAYGLIELEDYYFDTSSWDNPKGIPLNNPVPILTSRSCPQQCTFCSMHLVHGKSWRPRSAENVVDELDMLVNKYGHKFFTLLMII